MSTPVIKPSANISIVWGSANAAYGANANVMPSGLILETLTITPKNGEPIEIEGGEGFAVVQVGLDDGFNAKATAVYDSNKIIPAMGANVVLVVPKSDGTNAGQGNVNCIFWSYEITKSRKKETMITLAFSHRPDLNP